MKKLTAANVTEIIEDCLFKDGEIFNGQPPKDAVLVKGIVQNFGFHPGRLAAHKAEILELLHQLPDEFQDINNGGGGGWSFLNAYMTKDGVHWGEHNNIEELLCLGIATEQAEILMPREMWSAFPGGMPYFEVKETPYVDFEKSFGQVFENPGPRPANFLSQLSTIGTEPVGINKHPG